MLGSTCLSKPGSLGAGWPKGEKTCWNQRLPKSLDYPPATNCISIKNHPGENFAYSENQTKPNSEYLLYARNWAYLIASSQRLDKDIPC